MIESITSFDVEIPYKEVRYPFHVEMVGSDIYRFGLAGSSIDVRVREDPGGALIATFGGEMHRIVGRNEALGVRLNLDGSTILMPNIIDPSELRTDVTGKVVRYLQENGAMVEADTPYIEVEAMKMIMTMKTRESGKIAHALSPGTVIAAGDLLASLELNDPSKVKKIETYDGKLDIVNVPIDVKARDVVSSILDGYKNDPDAAAQNSFAEASDTKAIIDLVASTLNEFTRVEKAFDAKVDDDVVRDLTKADSENLGNAIDIIRAHKQLDMRAKLVLSMLRQISDFRSRFGLDDIPSELIRALRDIAKLDGKIYGDLKLLAASIVDMANQKPFDERVSELRSQLLDEQTDLAELSLHEDISAGVDLLTYLFSDENETVRASALEVYVRRIHRSRRLLDINVDEVDERLACSWSYQYMEQPASLATIHRGLLTVVPDLDLFSVELANVLKTAASKMDTTKHNAPFFGTKTDMKSTNELYIASGTSNREVDIVPIENLIANEKEALKMLGVARATVLQPIERQHPSYYTFSEKKAWKEEVIMRDVRPTYYKLLELARLEQNFELERLESVGKSVQVYVGLEKSEKRVRGGPPQVVFVRGISGTEGISTLKGAERALLQGLDELERAQSSSKVDSMKSSSRIYLQSSPTLPNTKPEELLKKFKEIVGVLKSRHANRLLKLRVDEIEVLLRLGKESQW